MFRFGSKKANRQEYRCSVRFLDDDEAPIDCDFQHMCLGQYVLDFVCSSIGLLEKDLFGLRYVDSHNQRRWLDLSKPVLKQEEACRYQVYLQLKRDLTHGRLNCTQSEAAFMVAYVKQAELGDWDTLAIGGTTSEDGLDDPVNDGNPADSVDNPRQRAHTFSTSRLLPKNSHSEIESRIERIHETLKGISATEAQDLFLKRAATLESYGIDPHPVKDEHKNQLYIGVNHLGVLTFRAGKRDQHIKFDDLVKFNYEGKMFILHVMTSGSNKKQVIGFRCPSQAACHHLFACANDIRCYFTSIPPLASKRNTLSRAMSILKKRETSLASLYPGHPSATTAQTRLPQISVDDDQVNQALDDFNRNRSCHPASLLEHAHYKDDESEIIRSGTSDVGSLLVNPDDEEGAGALGSNKPPILTPTLDGTPTHQRHQSDAGSGTGPIGPGQHFDHNGDVLGKHHVVGYQDSGNIYEPTETPLSEHPGYTLMECHDALGGKGGLPEGHPLLRHAQLVAFASLVMLLIITLSAIAVMESDSALFEEVKSWPPFVVLRREYYYPVKSFFSGRLRHPQI
ncbi:FERM domain-containing protein 5-like isoform X2 [Varroa destructor]|uniref:FERM domain-containing protein n=1 Tax=Varroa destructor TaxID=109461 RepID=A0A7M7KUI8_VARDE|nr:FERM domain-containing protein 5-like isoform X2 [Varroa destructor]